MNEKQYQQELEKEIEKLNKAHTRFDFWNNQDTFNKSQIDDIVEHGMSEEFTPRQLAGRLFEIVGL